MSKTKKLIVIPAHEIWQYHNTILLIISIVVLVFIARTEVAVNAINAIGNWRYFGTFFTGMFFVSTFTVAPAALVLIRLSEIYHPIEIAVFAGLGGVLGDFIIYRFIKDRVFEEISPIYKKYGSRHLKDLFKSPAFAWLAPVLGAMVIASPFPDELGITLMGISKLKDWQFLLIALVLDVLGIFIIVQIAASL